MLKWPRQQSVFLAGSVSVYSNQQEIIISLNNKNFTFELTHVHISTFNSISVPLDFNPSGSYN